MKKVILDVVTYIASKILDTGLPRKKWDFRDYYRIDINWLNAKSELFFVSLQKHIHGK